MLESVLDYEMYKIIGDFEIQTDQPILARRADLVIINNIIYPAIPVDNKLEIKESEKVLRPCLRTEKAMEHKNDSD